VCFLLAYCLLPFFHLCHTFTFVLHVLLCEDCKYEAKNELCNLIESGFWPGNVARKSNYLFSFELFNLFDKLHKFMPGSSVNGFVQAIKEISQQRGRVCLYIPY